MIKAMNHKGKDDAVGENIHLVEEQQFETTVASGVVLVDFYADWCGPCKMMTPILEEVAKEMVGKVSFVKVDTDRAQTVATQLNITSIPTLIVFKGGKEVGRSVGLRDGEAVRKMLTPHL